ncbi:MAG: hypothetical protein IT224_07330 [Flavobacteriales bacterium]|nr:hypothetical protein [Flavobacteriales bacterium]
MRTPLLLSFLFLALTTMAQAPGWLENTLYGNGKFNVGVVVVALIILGIGLWMWRMDRRISTLEKDRK